MLRMTQERETIAQKGREAVLHAHTGVHRANTILDAFHAADVHGFIKQRRSSLKEIRQDLLAVYRHATGVYELACQRYMHHNASWSVLFAGEGGL